MFKVVSFRAIPVQITRMKPIEDSCNRALNKKTLAPLSEKDNEERLSSQNFWLKGVDKAIIVQSFPLKEHFHRLKIEFERLSVCLEALSNIMDICFVNGLGQTVYPLSSAGEVYIGSGSK